MKSLLFDARMKSSSGVGVYISKFLPELRERFDLTVLGSDEADIKTDSPIYSIEEQITYAKIKQRFDIMWSPHYNVPFVRLAQKTVVTIHDVYHLAYYNTLSLKQKIYASLVLRKASSSNLILTVSNFSKREIQRLLKVTDEKIKVVYNGIDFEHFSRVYSVEESCRMLAQYKVDSPYILFVGNVKPHKNLKTALLAFELFCKQTSGRLPEFLIVGKKEGFITGDDEVASICQQQFFLKRVRFTGWVPYEDLPFLYQRASLFMFPSLYEGFGFPPLEAMAAGCPVISSQAACMPEIYGDAAIYFDATSPKLAADCLIKFFNNQKGDIHGKLDKARAHAKSYSWTVAVNQTVDLLNS